MDLHQQLKYFYQNQQASGQPEAAAEKPKRELPASVKMPAGGHSSHASQTLLNNQTINQLQRNIFGFIYLYAIVIVTLYLTYACYYFFQHHNRTTGGGSPTDELTVARSTSQQLAANGDELLESKFETKIHLLERYIELIAVDLQETKSRLREREKCDCSLGCTFNNTNYADNSSWQSQCDICACKAGKISCVPKKCPATNCDVAVTLAGQCCPTCMKKCKHNNNTYQHGHKFVPNPLDKAQVKECKCDDGRIKCEQKHSQERISNKLQDSLMPARRFKPERVAATQSKNATTSGGARMQTPERPNQLQPSPAYKADKT